MKSLLASLLLVGSVSAFAGPQQVSLICKGHELAPGDHGRSGSVAIVASTDGHLTVGNRWTLSSFWKDDQTAILNDQVLCGMPLTSASQCGTFSTNEQLQQINPHVPFSLVTNCSTPQRDDLPPPFVLGDAKLLLVSDRQHGRLSCSANGKSQGIELTDCRSSNLVFPFAQ